MGVIEILILGVSLSMDAFAVSICKGLSMKKINWKKAIIIGLYFGIFQLLMPIIGYFLGISLIGVKIGNKFGCKYEKKAQIIGGVILLLIGAKIFLEHLNVL